MSNQIASRGAECDLAIFLIKSLALKKYLAITTATDWIIGVRLDFKQKFKLVYLTRGGSIAYSKTVKEEGNRTSTIPMNRMREVFEDTQGARSRFNLQKFS